MFDAERSGGSNATSAAEPANQPPGRATLVQDAAAGDGAPPPLFEDDPVWEDAGGDVGAIAARGVAGPGGALPHLDAIQQSFGPDHDISGIRAHTGAAAAQASGDIGAAGYAVGNDVAFGGSADLHLAAHEAAHVVQQRAGVQLAGGVGAADDTYERNADAVADRVVAGQPAGDLLGPAAAAQSNGGGAPVQRKDADDGARSGEIDPEADDSEEATPANVVLAAGRPPGAVQKKETKSTRTAPRARAARALTLQQAVQRYAPLVFLAQGEKYRPANASEFIRNSSLRWSHDSGRGDGDALAEKGDVDERRLGDGGYQHQVKNVLGMHHGDQIRSNEHARPKDGDGHGGNEGFFLDLDNDNRESQRSGTDAPVYHEAVNQRFITYWFFYAYNDGPLRGRKSGLDNHEGDWERIVVRLDRRNRATEVAYYQHDGPPHTKSWRSVPKQGTHPIVYSANGSHASYDSPGTKNIDVPNLPDVDDKASRGAQWQTWKHLADVRQQGFYGYGGGWGEVGNFKHTTGPQGPSRHKGPAPKGW